MDKRHSLLAALTIGYALVTIAITVYQFQMKENVRKLEQLAIDSDNLKRLQETLQFYVSQEFKQKLEGLSGKVEGLALEERFKGLEEKIETIQNQTTGLRQAINPLKPEEILTIARLTDDIKILKKEQERYQETLESQQRIFQESILREIRSSHDSTNLIFLVLLPLVINFLYTVWKDFKPTKNDSPKV